MGNVPSVPDFVVPTGANYDALYGVCGQGDWCVANGDSPCDESGGGGGGFSLEIDANIMPLDDGPLNESNSLPHGIGIPPVTIQSVLFPSDQGCDFGLLCDSATADGGGYQDAKGNPCTPSVMNPSCKRPTCPAVVFRAFGDALDILPTVPAGHSPEDLVEWATSVAVLQHIVSRGLSTPLRSSIVRSIFAVGERAASVVAVAPVVYAYFVAGKKGVDSWSSGSCRTYWDGDK